MVSTRQTATFIDQSVQVPKPKKRRTGKLAKAKRAVAVEKINTEPVVEEDEVEGRGTTYEPPVQRVNATIERSQAVSKEHSRAVTNRSMNSQMIIDDLRDALKQRDDELDDMRRMMADRERHETEHRDYRSFGHAEDGVESSVGDDRRVVGAGHGIGGGYGAGPQWNSFKNFMDCKPPTFKGGEDPLGCMRWLRKMEQVFESGTFAENQKVVFASRVLEGEAADWWDMVSRSMMTERRAAITWADFTDRVRTRFCATSVVQRAGREFLDLRMGSMTVGKFNTLFLEKLQFARRFCPDEPSLVARYVEALPPDYRATIRGKPTLEAAMEEARLIEGDMKDKGTVVNAEKNKRKIEGSASSNKKKVGRYDGSKSDKSWCDGCGNKHKGPCSDETRKCRNYGKVGHTLQKCTNPPLCYNCKETDHISRDYPKEMRVPRCNNCGDAGHMYRDCPKPKEGKKVDAGRAKGRAFMMTADEAKDDEVVVADS